MTVPIELSRASIDYMFETGAMLSHGIGTTVLVEPLLDRGGDGDLQEAQAAIERLAATYCTNFPCCGYGGWRRGRRATKSLTASS